MEAFNFGEIRFWDILDVLIVAYLMYVIYKLLRGTRAFNIFIGVVLLYIIYLVVGFLDMKLLSLMLGKFVGFGVIILIIIFQPEVRKFLLVIGNNTLKGRLTFINRFLKTDQPFGESQHEEKIEEVVGALKWLSKQKMGALMVFAKYGVWSDFARQGTPMEASLNQHFIESVFYKNAPLHDGAMIVITGKVQAVKAVLPVSSSKSIAEDLGLRHRAALGMSENSDTLVLIVSEETGEISFAHDSKINRNAHPDRIKQLLVEYL